MVEPLRFSECLPHVVLREPLIMMGWLPNLRSRPVLLPVFKFDGIEVGSDRLLVLLIVGQGT